MKKKICVVLALTLITASALTGCGSKESEVTTNVVTFEEGADPYVGQWDDVDHSAVLDIWIDDEGTYHGLATWMQELNNVSFWEFDGISTKEGLELSGCTRSDVIYEDSGDDQETVRYEDATGIVTAANEALTFSIEGDTDTAEWWFLKSGLLDVESVEIDTEFPEIEITDEELEELMNEIEYSTEDKEEAD